MMKTTIVCALACALNLAARAAIVVPGADGSDGVLNITANTEIDLSQAVTGTWDQNNAANAGKGVYDPAKWAVVFKYSSVNVATGATVTFKNHASRAPVVWLVNGNVTISGTVSLDGKSGKDGNAKTPDLTEGGPGGFRGGSMLVAPGINSSKGFGPGGGTWYGGAGYATLVNTGGYNINAGPYGNPSLIPLIGGSGGGGYYNGEGSGGGGGGALLIASTAEINCSGTLRANGGVGGAGYGSGSGGGIRLVSESLIGGGAIQTVGGSNAGSGGVGRIRIERITTNGSLQITPDPSVVPLNTGASALLWPPSGAPEVKIVSIGSSETPADPRGSFGSFGADVALPQASSTLVVVETMNVEQAAVVKIRVTPRTEPDNTNPNITQVSATLDTIVSTDPLVIRWVATLPVNTGYSAVQAHVVRP